MNFLGLKNLAWLFTWNIETELVSFGAVQMALVLL